MSDGTGQQRRRECQERYQDDLAAYALSALDDSEARQLEEHLADCETCNERLRWLQPAVDLIPATVRQLDPPPALRERVMAAVRAEAPQHEAVSDAAARTPEPKPRRRRFSLRVPDFVSLRPALAGLGVAAAIAAAIAGGYAVGTGDGPDRRSFSFDASSPTADASGTVEIEDGSGTLQVKDMPKIPKDEVYQAWVTHNGEIDPSSVFVVRKDGSGSATLPEVPDDTESVLVTREPAGGSTEPQSEALATATFD